MGGAIGQVRRFNRTVTEHIGALDEAFLARPRPLGYSRVLWEIGVDGAEVRSLRERLDLDSGYLSRVLRALEDEGLIELTPAEDRRIRSARMTPAGRAEHAHLEALSDEAASVVLSRLVPVQRQALVEAMTTVEKLLRGSLITIGPADPRDASPQRCLQAYYAELGDRLDGGFDAARSIPAAAVDLLPPAGVFLVAWMRRSPVGCVGLKLHQEQYGEVKRMWVAGAARGLGLGRRLLDAVEDHAAAGGMRSLRLETNRALSEAIGLYRSAGYREVPAFNEEPFAHLWFEKSLDPGG